MLLRGGIADATELLEGYTHPFTETFSANLNSGWINSGNPLRMGRIQVKLVLPISIINEDMKSFNLDELRLSNPRTYISNGIEYTERWSFSNSTAQTVFGDKNESTRATKILEYTDPNSGNQIEQNIASFNMPSGTGFGVNFIPPALQVTGGIGNSTQLMLRFTPPYTGSTASFNSWGLGIMHDLTKSINSLKAVPFNLSVAYAFTRLNGKYNFQNSINFVPTGGYADPTLPGTGYTGPQYNPSDFNNQEFIIYSTGSNLSFIISKRFPFLTPYAGFRIISGFTQIGFDGNYAFAGLPYFNPNDANDPNNGRFQLEKFTNPLAITDDLRLLGTFIGLRVKLGLFTVFAEHNYARFNTLSVGVGMGIFN